MADFTIVPLWNVTVGVSTNQTDSNSCHLVNASNMYDAVKLTGETDETCSVQLTTSNGTAALIKISKGAEHIAFSIS